MKPIVFVLLPLALTATACTVEHTVYEPSTREYHSYSETPGTPYEYDQTAVAPDGSTTEYHHIVRPYTATEYHHVETTNVPVTHETDDDE